MARTRPYSVQFNNVTVSALQDLIAVYCGANMAIELHGLDIGQITGTTVQNLRISLKRLAATVTAGSVGSAPTPQKMMRGDAAATATARANDTTQATTSGATAVLLSDVLNVVNGYQFMFAPDDRPTFGPNEACVLSLDQAPSSPIVMSGTLNFAELF